VRSMFWIDIRLVMVSRMSVRLVVDGNDVSIRSIVNRIFGWWSTVRR